MPESAKRYTGKRANRGPQRATVHKAEAVPRKGSTARGYNVRWQRARLVYLAEHPLCVECKRHGFTREATVVDHVRPHRGDPELFWDSDNWCSLCKACHDRKTARGQ